MSLYIINQSRSKPEIALEFDEEDRCFFYNPLIEKEIKQFGIYIPPGIRDQYANREYVPLPDSKISGVVERSLFKKAFIEVYFELHLANRKFVIADTKGDK
ncbi:MAG: hypothetical protein FJZ59_03635 [Chlamydiae bacterium]|jgi:hypothetical protein|nr:hypothetical protein [Chlamydiota bacterium]